MYLLESDYTLQIQADNLDQITSSSPAVRIQAEGAAVAEMISYLVQKYNTDLEFASATVFSMTATYLAGARVYLDGPAWSNLTLYTGDDIVLYLGNIYQALGSNIGVDPVTGIGSGDWILLGAQFARFYVGYPQPVWNIYQQYFPPNPIYFNNRTYVAAQPSIGVYPNDPSLGPVTWGLGTAFSITGTPVYQTPWVAGDNRNPQTVLFVIDMTLYHLHSRIAPYNIPELRKDRYEDAISWLKAAATGKITADLVRIQPLVGNRIRHGGDLHQTWGY